MPISPSAANSLNKRGRIALGGFEGARLRADALLGEGPHRILDRLLGFVEQHEIARELIPQGWASRRVVFFTHFKAKWELTEATPGKCSSTFFKRCS